MGTLGTGDQATAYRCWWGREGRNGSLGTSA